MAIIKWDDFNRLDNFFDDTFPFSSKVGWDLAIDVYDEGENLIAEVNLPGLKQEDIDVTVEDGYLRIAGSREEEKEDKDEKKHYYSKEIRRGSFERIIRLTDNIERENVTATYKNGVLKVTMPKKEKKDNGSVKVEVK